MSDPPLLPLVFGYNYSTFIFCNIRRNLLEDGVDSYLKKYLILLMAGFLAACGGGAGDGDYGSSGGSYPAMSSIIGYTMVQTVRANDGKSSTISPGKTITYSFIDKATILGEGLNTVATTAWSYSKNGNSATVRLEYGSRGYSIDTLQFTSATSGTYESSMVLSSGTTGRHSGTFVIKPNSGSSSSNSSSSAACTSKITIWTSNLNAGGVTPVVDGKSVGTISYRSGAPVCGNTTYINTITVDLAPGIHTISATSNRSYTWPQKTFTIGACECLLYTLN